MRVSSNTLGRGFGLCYAATQTSGLAYPFVLLAHDSRPCNLGIVVSFIPTIAFAGLLSAAAALLCRGRRLWPLYPAACIATVAITSGLLMTFNWKPYGDQPFVDDVVSLLPFFLPPAILGAAAMHIVLQKERKDLAQHPAAG